MPKIKTSDTEFDLPHGANLLEALEKTGHSVEYQCRGGYCGSCRVKLRSGSVRYADLPMAFVAADEILPCCCVVEQDIEIVCHLLQTD
jgi:ferredoxin